MIFFIYLFKLLKHYLQYKEITGAAYNNAIPVYITYITNNMTTYSNYNPIYTLLTKIIQYLHPYCNNEQQNKNSLITY